MSKFVLVGDVEYFNKQLWGTWQFIKHWYTNTSSIMDDIADK